MTDRKYKLVPVEPTEAMETAHRLYGDTSDWWNAVISAAPEPVCRWEYFTGLGYSPQCVDPAGHKSALRQKHPDDAFCPHCGKKVEVVGDE